MIKLGNPVSSSRIFEGHKCTTYKEPSSGKLRVAGADILNKTRSLDISWLPIAAEEYNISPDIRDYIINEIPIVAVDMPNRNMDAFPFDEVSSFNSELGRLVYATFIGKPTHRDHDNRDPRKARGVHFDAQLEKVGSTGLYKITVLAGWDRTKDPDLVRQILSGERNGFCITGNSLINTSKGLIQIKDLGPENSGVREEVSINDIFINTPNGRGKIRSWYYSGEKEVKELCLSSNKTITGSNNQMVLVLNSDLSITWTELRDINVGDFIAVDSINNDFLWPVSLELPSFSYDSGTKRTVYHDPIECTECGEDTINLVSHIRYRHNLTTTQYKKEFDYDGPWTAFTSYNSKPKNVNIPTSMTPALATILGYLISEGNCCWIKDTYQIGFSSTHKDQIYQYCKAYKEVFGYEPKVSKKLGEIGKIHNYVNGNAVTQREYYYKVYDYSIVVGNFLKDIFGECLCYAKEKSISKYILESPRNCVVSFIKSLYLGDGSGFFRDINSSYKCIRYHSISAKLKEQLMILLLKFGIKSKIVTYGDCDLIITGFKNITRFMKEIIGNHNFNKFDNNVVRSDIIPFLSTVFSLHFSKNNNFSAKNQPISSRSWIKSEEGKELLKSLPLDLYNKISDLLNLHCEWEEVIDITDMGLQHTYDLTVEGPNGILNDSSCFSANGIFVHNSMGALVGYTQCSYPGCDATSTNGRIACNHMQYGKGKGRIINGHVIYENCRKVNYIETSSVDDAAQYDAIQRWKEPWV